MYWATGILGFVLLSAPYLFGYSSNEPALWTSLLVGLATVGVSLIEGVQKNNARWEYWIATILGMITVVAPFVLGFSNVTEALLTSVITGLMLALFAGSKLSTGELGKA